MIVSLALAFALVVGAGVVLLLRQEARRAPAGAAAALVGVPSDAREQARRARESFEAANRRSQEVSREARRRSEEAMREARAALAKMRAEAEAGEGAD
ncbi:hypothetical protein B2G71_06415 [Novosphingobium sp. PC22D]|uniref:hypothetical protein n=1 Tax=Novosphingobium sp. PC22D TaxID=1962403 RepID=UPI000BF023BA|nr:hypothetical protein [Novosphingobium sp. PC22D]PEQ13929.1 hypothetical protein B2G71_06415 [Novosphingobium sp. PC22D]